MVTAGLLAGLIAGCGSDGQETGSSSPSDVEATTTAAPSGTVADVGTTTPVVESLTVAAPSLAGNLVGDPAELEVAVRLPASYSDPDASERRYPTVYFLAGYDETVAIGPVVSGLDELEADGTVPEVIVVAISGRNAFGGSFYVDSPVTGNWAQAVYVDVVGAVDATYRTAATREARGIAGFSMGGFGALDLAMRHPDVFGSVYALSPGLFDPTGLADSQMFADPSVVAEVLAGRAELAGAGDATGSETAALVRTAMSRSGSSRFASGYGMAFAPDPAAGPPWFDYPYDQADGPRDDDVWARWEAGYGGVAGEAAAFADDLRSLRGILVDYGVNDENAWIPPGCEYFATQLTANDVPVRLERYDGGHGPVSARAAAVMWPFFAGTLAP